MPYQPTLKSAAVAGAGSSHRMIMNDRPLRSAEILRPEKARPAQYLEFYLTLDPDDALQRETFFTNGDVVHAKAHIRPQGSDSSLTLSNMRVGFKCRVLTAFIQSGSTRPESNLPRDKYSTALFSYESQLVGPHKSTVNKHQTWDVAFQFPWAVQEHPSQRNYPPRDGFAHEAGFALPPTMIHDSTVEYILRLTATRHGSLQMSTEAFECPLKFLPSLRGHPPSRALIAGYEKRMVFALRKQNPEMQSVSRTRRLFQSETSSASAVFTVTAKAPMACCAGDRLPIHLDIFYNTQSSTVATKPDLRIKEIRVRLLDRARARKPGSSSGLLVTEQERTIVSGTFPDPPIMTNGMDLNQLGPIVVSSATGPSFETFSLNRSYKLDVNIDFVCRGKRFECNLLSRDLTIHAARVGPDLPIALHESRERKEPTANQSSSPEYQEEELPPYTTNAEGDMLVPYSVEDAGASNLERDAANVRLHEIDDKSTFWKKDDTG